MDLTYLGKLLKIVEQGQSLVKYSNWGQNPETLTQEENQALNDILVMFNNTQQAIVQAKVLKGSSGAKIVSWVNQNPESLPQLVSFLGATEKSITLKIDLSQSLNYQRASQEKKRDLQTFARVGFLSNYWTKTEAVGMFKAETCQFQFYDKKDWMFLQFKYSKKIVTPAMMPHFLPLLFSEVLAYTQRKMEL